MVNERVGPKEGNLHFWEEPLHQVQRGLHSIITIDFHDYIRKWGPLAILIGIVAGVGAMAFQLLLEAIWSLSYHSVALPWFIIIFLPAAGAFLAGAVMQRWSPESAGGGTDSIIESLQHKGGDMPSRVAPVKIVASSLTIGSGGSAGREGAISHICGSLGSLLGNRLHLSRSDRRILVICGMAAGLSAVFRAPLGSAIYAIEVPYKNDLESSAAIPAIIASVVSYLVFLPFGGFNPIFEAPEIPFELSLGSIPFIILVGLIAGLASIALILLLRSVADIYGRSKLSLPLAAGSAGLLVGVIGLVEPEVLGLSEDVIQDIITGSVLTVGALVVLLVAKVVATSLTVGSGGSGGVFFPSLLVGAAIGGAVASSLSLQPAALFTLAGMGAVMAGVSKTPLAAPILVTEMVGGYSALIPIMIASTISYLATGDYSLYKNQITRRAFRLDLSNLSRVKVRRIMTSSVVSVREDMTLLEVKTIASQHPHYLYPVVTAENSVVGVLPMGMVGQDRWKLVREVMQTHYEEVEPDSSALDAFERMTTHQISRMLVIENGRLAGVLTRLDVVKAMEHLDERHRNF